MNLIDSFFWMTGYLFWAFAACVGLVFGLPAGRALRGVTRFTFYEFGPVLWRVLPANEKAFELARRSGYRFLRLRERCYVGFSLPRWLSRRLGSLAGDVA